MRMGSVMSKEFGVSIVTNGTIMNDEVERILKKYLKPCHINLQLSVDAVEPVNDLYRIFLNGDGTFKKVEKNIPRFKEIFGKGFLDTNKRGSLHVHGSLGKEAIRVMHESYKYFTEVWGIPTIWFMPIQINDWTNEDADIYKEQLNLIANDIIKKTKENNDLRYLLDYAPLNRAAKDKDPFPSIPCGAGRNYCTFTADGLIYPCHQFYFSDHGKEMCIGNIEEGLDETRRNIFTYYGVEDVNCHRGDHFCDLTSCYRCIAENFEQNGTILNCTFGPRCRMMHTDEAVIDMLRMELREQIIGYDSRKEQLVNDDKMNQTEELSDAEKLNKFFGRFINK
jgi:radical SAM protein with 4Fe4S-binding SPASM domain